MGRRCRWCDVLIQDENRLKVHEQAHRNLDMLAGIESQIQSDTVVQEGGEAPGKDIIEVGSNEFVSFSCDSCQKQYSAKSSLLRHQRMEHDMQQFKCSKCEKKFSRLDNKQRHETACTSQTDHVCPQCQKRCATANGLRRHLQWHEKAPKKPTPTSQPPTKLERTASTSCPVKTVSSASAQAPHYRCRRCTEVFENRRDLYLHGMQRHFEQVGGALQPQPWGRNEVAPWDGDDALREVYEANAPLILQQHHQGPMSSVFNYPISNNVSLNQLLGFAEDIYQRQHRAFRLDLVFGVILQHRETGQYRYFVPYNNNGIFERPLYISRRADLLRFRRQLETKDILIELLRQRPDTKWIPVLVTNVHFIVYETFYPLGQGILPDYLNKKDSLYSLVKNKHTGKTYKDNLCAFRCLALHRGHDIKSLEGPALAFYYQWTDDPHKDFEGLSFEDFPQFESRFDVNLEVYNLTEDGFARSVYKSRGQHATTMYVNMYENHLSYIRDFAIYAQKYQCKTCNRHFDHAGHLHCHEKACTNKTKFVYPGGFHRARESIFEQLDQYEIHVPEDERTFPWYICYDLEALLQKMEDQPTDMLQWTAKHVPVSVSICSNVEGNTKPVCLVDADQDQLVGAMVAYMQEIADRVYELAEDKWSWIFEAIDEKINETNSIEDEIELEGSISSDADMEDEEARETTKKTSHPLQKVYRQLETYMSQVPVLGFNSAKYDVNLIKRCLAKHLSMHEDSTNFVVKKNNAYTCLAYKVTQQKGFFVTSGLTTSRSLKLRLCLHTKPSSAS